MKAKLACVYAMSAAEVQAHAVGVKMKTESWSGAKFGQYRNGGGAALPSNINHYTLNIFHILLPLLFKKHYLRKMK